MEWNVFAAYASPIITALVAFLLAKYFYNKSELIAYYGHVSAHKLPNDTGYLINIIEFDTKPDKAQLDLHYKEKIPLIIKFNTEIWIYGFDNDGSTKLKKSSNTDPYSSLSFSKKIELAVTPRTI